LELENEGLWQIALSKGAKAAKDKWGFQIQTEVSK